MELIYNAKNNRKELVSALETLTQEKAVYLKAPSYGYLVAGYTVTREGNIIVPDDTEDTETDELIASLENMGFVCIMTEKHEDLTVKEEEPETEPEEDKSEDPEESDADEADEDEEEAEESEPEPAEEKEPTHVTLSFPVELFAQDAIDRMKAIVASKQSLLKKALDTDNLDIEVQDGKVCFPWFTDHGLEGEVDAYSKLAFAIAKMAITQNRVTATEKQNPDEKLAMRLFLIRLNFIGDEYKSARAILMRNFNSSVSRKQVEAAINLCMPEVSTSSAKEDADEE